jgi:hypothetical protein
MVRARRVGVLTSSVCLWSVNTILVAIGCSTPTVPSVAEPLVFELVAQRREWLGGGRCPAETMLRNMESQPALAREEPEQLKGLVEQDGCNVLENTEAVFDSGSGRSFRGDHPRCFRSST